METFACQPLIECIDPTDVTLEQIPAVEIGGLSQRVNRSGRDQRIEASDIDLNRGGTETDCVTFAGKKIGRKESQRETKVACQASDVVDAEERAEIVERNRGVSMQRQPHQERLRFAATDRQRIAAMIGSEKFSKQTN